MKQKLVLRSGIGLTSILASVIVLVLLTGCGATNVGSRVRLFATLDSIKESTWEKLAGKKIFFGHPSVGDNMVDGINLLMNSNTSIKLNIVKTRDPAIFEEPVFAHDDVGKNDDPELKIRDFSELMESGIGARVNIALLKLCFWDISEEKDINAIFKEYVRTFSILKKEYPKTVFIHLTVPLMHYAETPEDRKERQAKGSVQTDRDNVKRNDLNRLIVNYYRGKEPVFDIAAIESTLPDGSRTSFYFGGVGYYCLAPQYTYDGGHLNQEGRRRMAEELLRTLASIVEPKHP